MGYDSTMMQAFGEIAIGFVILFIATPEQDKGNRTLFKLGFFALLIVISSIMLEIQNDTFTVALWIAMAFLFFFQFAMAIYLPILKWLAETVYNKKIKGGV